MFFLLPVMLVEFLFDHMILVNRQTLSCTLCVSFTTQKNSAKTVQHTEWIILYKYSKQSCRLQGAPAQTTGHPATNLVNWENWEIVLQHYNCLACIIAKIIFRCIYDRQSFFCFVQHQGHFLILGQLVNSGTGYVHFQNIHAHPIEGIGISWG